MAKGILVDLGKLKDQDMNEIECSYPDHLENNNGVIALARELSFIEICRKCELAPCIDACPYDALERLDTGIIRRHNFICKSCKSCVAACPFGVINFEFMDYIDSICDLCTGRLEEGELPVCVKTSKDEAITYGDFKEDKENFIFKIKDNLYVKVRPWGNT